MSVPLSILGQISKSLFEFQPNSLNLFWEIQDFKNKIANDSLKFESNVYYLHEVGCQLKFTFHLKPSIYFQVHYVTQPSDREFPLNGHHRITFILEDQMDNKPINAFIPIFEPTFNNWTNSTLLRLVPTNDRVSFLLSRWLKDGRVLVKVILEPLRLYVAHEPRHYGHMWYIHNYGKSRGSYNYGRQCLWSDVFYSSEGGYRMREYLFYGSRVHFLLNFLKGPWDNQLSKTFKHRSTFPLISQKPPTQLTDKTITKESFSVTSDDVFDDITEAELEKYVKDDILIVSFNVKSL